MVIDNVTYEYHHTAMAKGYIRKAQDGLTEDYMGRFGEGKKIHRHTTQTIYYHPIEYWIKVNGCPVETNNLLLVCRNALELLETQPRKAGYSDICLHLHHVCVTCQVFGGLSRDKLFALYNDVKALLGNAEKIADDSDKFALWLEIDNLWGKCVREQPLSEHF